MTELTSEERTGENLIASIREYMKKGHVLDLGCGEGDYAIFLAKQGFRVTALDLDADKLQRLEDRARRESVLHRIEIKHADILHGINGEWDVVILSRVLHFIPWKEACEAIGLAQRLTRPHGLHACIFWTDQGQLPRLSTISRSKRYFFPAKPEIHLFYQDWDKRLKSYRPAETPLEPGRVKRINGELCLGLFQKRP